MHDLLVTETMPLSLASVLVERYANAETDEVKFIQDIVETIADIKQPLVQVVTTAMKENQRRNDLQVSCSIDRMYSDLMFIFSEEKES